MGLGTLVSNSTLLCLSPKDPSGTPEVTKLPSMGGFHFSLVGVYVNERDPCGYQNLWVFNFPI